MEKYVLVQRNKLPVVRQTDSISALVSFLMENNLGCFQDVTYDGNNLDYIAYLSYGKSTREMIDGKVVPNRAIHEFGGRDVAGIIWNDEFVIVRHFPEGYFGLSDDEIKIAKRTFSRSSIKYAKSLGFLP